MPKIELLIIDKREIFREGLRRLLEPEPNIEIVGVYCTDLKAIAGSNEHQPDVILIGIELPRDGVIETLQRIRDRLSKAAIIVLTHLETADGFYSAVIAGGARGYISKDIKIESLIKAIFLAADGAVIISPIAASKMLVKSNYLHKREDVTELRGAALSKQEQTVLSLVAQGLTNKEIAATLFLSEYTAKVHLRNIMRKLGAHTRQQAVALVTAKDLLPRLTETGAK